MMLQFEENNLSVTYYLCAQLDPYDDSYLAFKDGTSKLRCDTTVYFTEKTHLEDAKIERELSVKVGGIGGLGASEAKCKISLARFAF